MPRGRSRRKICPRCHKAWTRQTVYRHLVLGCTRREQEATRRRVLENVLSPPRRRNLPLRLRNNPPSSPRPPPSPISPSHRKRGRGPGRKRIRRNSGSDGSDVDLDAFLRFPPGDVRSRSQDFVFDTPGAGPSNGRPRPLSPFDDDDPCQLFEDEWDANVPIDSDSDDGRPDGPTLVDNAPWLNGLTASAVPGQELEAEIARAGEDDMKAVRGFNYKVDTDISVRAYDKLPRAFPHELGDLPKHFALRTRDQGRSN